MSVNAGELVLTQTGNQWWTSLSGQKTFTHTSDACELIFEFEVTDITPGGSIDIWTNIGYSATITSPGHYTHTFPSWNNTITFGYNAGSALPASFTFDNFKIIEKDAVPNTEPEKLIVTRDGLPIWLPRTRKG